MSLKQQIPTSSGTETTRQNKVPDGTYYYTYKVFETIETMTRIENTIILTGISNSSDKIPNFAFKIINGLKIQNMFGIIEALGKVISE